jgi:3-deoxy-D-manno-octulosonic-acid transferase
MTLLYRLLTAASMLLLVPYYFFRGLSRGEPSRTFRERFGILPQEVIEPLAPPVARKRPIWIHAVSVGEVLAAKPLCDELKKHFPAQPIYVSTTTETGQSLARERLSSADAVFYFPVDWTLSVRRALDGIRPAMIIIMETEIWPNFLREAYHRAIPVIFANARISKKSFERFNTWKFAAGGLFKSVLNDVKLILAQTAEDASRLVALGAPESQIEVTGNLKYDAEPPAKNPFCVWLDEEVRRQERWPLLVAGSVVAEEEQHVLAAFDAVQRKWRRALLVLAPRKPGQFESSAEIISQGGWEIERRSKLDLAHPLSEDADVLLLDSIGELAGIYSLADAVFVGGSLVPVGGHNILEPAWFSRPPVFGTSMENFQEMADRFLAEHAGIQVRNGPMLGKVWIELIEDNASRERMGRAAQSISQRNRGATSRAVERITELLHQQDLAP